MSNDFVLCSASSEEQANRIVSNLQNANFSSQDITVLNDDQKTRKPHDHEMHLPSTRGAIVGAIVGVFIGGCSGWMTGFEAAAIRDIHPLTSGWPTVVALIGSAVGGIAGELIGMCISVNNAKRHAETVREGNIRILVHAEKFEEIVRAKKIFSKEGAHEICTSGEIRAHRR